MRVNKFHPGAHATAALPQHGCVGVTSCAVGGDVRRGISSQRYERPACSALLAESDIKISTHQLAAKSHLTLVQLSPQPRGDRPLFDKLGRDVHNPSRSARYRSRPCRARSEGRAHSFDLLGVRGSRAPRPSIGPRKPALTTVTSESRTRRAWSPR